MKRPSTPDQAQSNKLLGEHLRKLRKARQITTHEVKVWLDMDYQSRNSAESTRNSANVSYINAVERGEKRLSRSQLQRILDLYQPSYPDQVNAFGYAGYIPPTKLPYLSEIKRMLAPHTQFIAEKAFPAYIVDFRAEVWAINHVTTALVRPNTPLNLLQDGINLCDVFYNPKHSMRGRIPDTEFPAFVLEQTKRIKILNVLRQFEPFYQNFVNGIAAGLSPTDAELFRTAWERAAYDPTLLNSRSTYMLVPEGVRFEVRPLMLPHHFGLFYLIEHYPIPDDNAEVFKQAEAILSPYRVPKVYHLWDFGDDHAQRTIDGVKFMVGAQGNAASTK